MITKRLLLYFFLLLCFLGISQDAMLSPNATISVLTVGTGKALATKFGHSAIRLQDDILGIDEVYGYGTYNFEDPNFYWNFVRGKLAYTVTRYSYTSFKQNYISENRWVNAQVLELSIPQKETLIRYLETNLLPENRFYTYDFLFENCATKIPEVLKETLGVALLFDATYLKDPQTFRQLIHQSLATNSWATFGIDLALGSVIDIEATTYEHLFLPKYVYEQLKHTTFNNKPLVSKELVLVSKTKEKTVATVLSTPLLWLSLFSILVLFITYIDYTNNKRSYWLDGLLFFTTGTAGIVILFLWFFTDHVATKLNYNCLWAFAPNLFVTILIVKSKIAPWLKSYIRLALVLLLLGVVLWLLNIQQFSILLLLVLPVLAVRYIFLLHYFNNKS